MVNSSDLFKKQGYVIFRNAFSSKKIEKIFKALEGLKKRKYKPFYFSQATHRYKQLITDKYGFIDESILGFSRNKFLGELSRLSSNLLLSKEMKNYLKEVFPYYEEFVQQNNMLFDRSMETVDHIDSWYLDTHPKGGLFGAWIALENINKESGPFRVYPGSHKEINAYKLQSLKHNDFIKEINNFKKNFVCKELILKSGDLIIWHSSLIHGASNVINNSYSRKSLTAHYYPLNATSQSLFSSSPYSIKSKISNLLLKSPNRKKHDAIYQQKTKLGRFCENYKYASLYLYNFMTSKKNFGEVKNDMRSSSYKK